MSAIPSPDRPLRLGTRGSPLALAQAREARARLMAAHGLPEAAFEIVVIRTTGDKVTDRPLGEIGGKGLFTREIEEALLAGAIDAAVHSMKDMPTLLPEGLAIACLLPREDPRDAYVSLAHASLAEMPAGAVVGTSSLRRRAQMLNRHPGLRVVEFRGNVQTRLRKLQEGVAEATFLAAAGLRRLGRDDVIRAVMDADEMLPAVAQGAIGLETRAADAATRALLAPIHDTPTGIRIAAERAFLAGLDGSCRTPIAGLAEIMGERLRLRGEIIRPDGTERLATERSGPLSDAAAMGADAARELRARAGPGFFDA
ncbi:MAG TPA: hydroxymethylbilane synthase [Thermohalobaculum sp.]|nr:hydroxymethylbilane synthase [Thermohalobaculum sp.]